MGFFIVSRRALLRDLMASFCASEGLEVHGVAENLAEISTTAPDPIVLLHLAHGDPLEAKDLEAFRERYGEARIVVLCSQSTYGRLQALPPGLIEAMVLDNSSLRSLSGVLTLVHEGFMITPAETPETTSHPEQPAASRKPGQPRHGDRAADRGATGAEEARAETTTAGAEQASRRAGAARKEGGGILSRREAAVIRKLCEGASNKDIANALNIGESTVKVHLRACYRKIGVRNRTQAAIWAAKHLPDTSRFS